MLETEDCIMHNLSAASTRNHQPLTFEAIILMLENETKAISATLPTNPISAFRADGIHRALLHGQLHIDRGIARAIDAPDNEDAESEFMTAMHALGDATGEAEREAASDAAHDALDRWKLALERLAGGPDDPHTEQCVELDYGELRSLLRVVDALDYLDTDECRVRMTDHQILIAVASELFACPPAPEEY